MTGLAAAPEAWARRARYGVGEGAGGGGASALSPRAGAMPPPRALLGAARGAGGGALGLNLAAPRPLAAAAAAAPLAPRLPVPGAAPRAARGGGALDRLRGALKDVGAGTLAAAAQKPRGAPF